ncbi:MAG TPA: cysteine desulfurase [Chitinophagaceae bacterium]|nr:cysteine desulfurase [Chitinophagaceae bacterium]
MIDEISNKKATFDLDMIRSQFPVLNQKVNGHPLVYLDNAATSQTPISVIDALREYYEYDNSNIHRGIHTLAERATAHFEETREAIRKFINAGEKEEIIFTSGTTAGLNLVAQTYGRKFLRPGDEVIISAIEHHSNIVPWQLICEEKGAKLRVIPLADESGVIDMEVFKDLLSEKTAIVSVTYASNSLGTINPVDEIIREAHGVGARVVIDAAQAVVHKSINVQDLDCDFLVFSGHKMYGPTGVGVLYGKREFLESMPPYQGGGEMIETVSFEHTTFNEIPYKFEAGTPNIGAVIALKEAVAFMDKYHSKEAEEHEEDLLEKITEGLSDIDGIRLIGTAPDKIGVSSFISEYVHHFDMGMMLDARGVAIRTGHHCTEPLMNIYNIEGTNRASFGIYNTFEEVDIFLNAVEHIQQKRKK